MGGVGEQRTAAQVAAACLGKVNSVGHLVESGAGLLGPVRANVGLDQVERVRRHLLDRVALGCFAARDREVGSARAECEQAARVTLEGANRCRRSDVRLGRRVQRLETLGIAATRRDLRPAAKPLGHDGQLARVLAQPDRLGEPEVGLVQAPTSIW